MHPQKIPAEDQVADDAVDGDLSYSLFEASVGGEVGLVWMAKECWERNGVMLIAERSGRARCSRSSLGNVVTMAVAVSQFLSPEKLMQSCFVYRFVPALLPVCWKEKHHGWAKMAAEEELEVCMRDGAVLVRRSLVAAGEAHIYMSSSSVVSGAVVQVAG